MPKPPVARRRVVDLCLALPDAAVEGDQHLRFSVRGRTFAYYLDDHHGDGIEGLAVKVPLGENVELAGSAPELFYLPPYLAPRGWVGYRLDVAATDWAEAAGLVVDSYRAVAPKRLAREV